MIEIFTAIGVLLAGLLLGCFFFGGLLWTVGRGLLSKRPALWFLGSWIVRASVILGGFYLVSAGQWQRLLLCAAGFLIARLLMFRYMTGITKTDRTEKEAGNAT